MTLNQVWGARSRVTLRATLLLAAGALISAAACSSESLFSKREEVSAAASAVVSASANAIPCAARAAAVVANTGKVVAQGNSLVDAYDSGLGPYGGANVHNGGAVRAGTSIDVLGGTITGGKNPNSPANLPTVAIPSGARNLPLGAGAPGNVNVNGLADSITLSPGNYVVDNLNINSPGQLKLQPAGQVNIYVKGTLNIGGTENANGFPNHLNFFVSSTNTVNVNSNGKLFGNIYAPKATVNVSSVIFGSVIGSAVNLNSGAKVHADDALACPAPPIIAERPRTLPLPPRQRGCYYGTSNGWVQTPCTTRDTLRDEFKTPEPMAGITNTAAATTPIQFAEVDTTITALGTLVDVPHNWQNALSVQANTNQFPSTKVPGHKGWVQFTVQTAGGMQPGTAVCIWSWDIDNLGAWLANCVGGYSGMSPMYDIPVPSRPLQQYDFATVGGSVFLDDQGQPSIGLVARYSYFDPTNDPGNHQGLFAVVAPDEHGLGATGSWTQISGGIYGVGSGSYASFKNSSVLTRLLAGTCASASPPTPAIPWPGYCPTQPALLPNASVFEATNVTGESNNLVPITPISSLGLLSDSPELVFTQYLASDTGACIANSERVYVKDHPSDTGVVPSNLSGQPFWASPDLFVVPTGATVSEDATPSETLLTAGQTYDAYVRVNNNYSCGPVGGVKAKVYLADPAALSTTWTDVTGGSGEYRGSTASAAGISVPASSRKLVGPFTFTAPSSGFGDGHKCLLAAIMSDTEPAVANVFDAPASYQVAQRNLQISECAYPLSNATTSNGNVSLTLTVQNATPSLSGSIDIEMEFTDPVQAWHNVWAAAPGASDGSYAVSWNSATGKTTVRLGKASVSLPAVPLAAGTTVTAEGLLYIDSTVHPGAQLDLDATLRDGSNNILVHNGGSCFKATPSEPH